MKRKRFQGSVVHSFYAYTRFRSLCSFELCVVVASETAWMLQGILEFEIAGSGSQDFQIAKNSRTDQIGLRMVLMPVDEELIPQPYLVDFSALQNATQESEYLRESFELLKETASWLALVVSMRTAQQPEGMERNQAVCAGQLVRMYKILRLVVRQIVDDHGGDHQMALTREFIESAAVIAYLLEETSDSSRFESYLHDSLIPERELLSTIEAQVKKRGGIRQPIEDRMERSVVKTLRRAGIKLEDIPSRKKNGWPSVETRVRLLGPTAYTAYRSGSSGVHGTWSDLTRNHLDEVVGGFVPNLEPVAFRPQALLLMGFLSTVSIELYSAEFAPLPSSFAPPIIDLAERIRDLDIAHELFLNR